MKLERLEEGGERGKQGITAGSRPVLQRKERGGDGEEVTLPSLFKTRAL